MSPAVTPGQVSRAAVLEIGERLTEAPSDRLADIAFARELKAQTGPDPRDRLGGSRAYDVPCRARRHPARRAPAP